MVFSRYTLALSTAVGSLITCTSAVSAQTAASPAQEQAGAPAEAALGDIIVTAERRAVNLQDVSIAITAVTGQALKASGVQDGNSLSRLVPGLEVINSGTGGTSFFLRGVGSPVTSAFGDPAIAFSVDGVFFSRQVGADTVFYDLARVEVLKGPQGTLYGRNATSGAVNVITNRPTFDDVHAEGSFEYGNYNTMTATGVLNVPFSDAAAIRAAVRHYSHDGYYKDGTEDADTNAARLSFLYQPGDDVKLFLSGDYAHLGGRGPGRAIHGPDPGTLPTSGAGTPANGVGNGDLPTEWIANDPWIGICAPETTAYFRSRVAARGAPTSIYNGAECNGSQDNKVFGLNSTLDFDLDFATLTVVGGYRGVRQKTAEYQSQELNRRRSRSDLYTGEVRLASNNDGPLQWIVGGIYSKEKLAEFTKVEQQPDPSPAGGGYDAFLLLNIPHLRNRAFGAFAQGTFSVTDTLRLIGGIRYTDEKKVLGAGTSIPQVFPTTQPVGEVNAPGAPFAVGAGAKFNATNYRVGMEYDIADANLFYANYSTGFHAGGLNPAAQQGPLPASTSRFEPETIRAWAVGSKNRFIDGLIQLNVEAYYWKYKNLQVAALSGLNGGPGVTFLGFPTLNAGRAHVQGLDADLLVRPGRNDTISIQMLYNDSKYDYFVIPNFLNPAAARIRSGRHIQLAPQWTVTAQYEHRFDLGNDHWLSLIARTNYKSSYYTNFDQQPGTHQNGFTRSDVEAVYTFPSDRFQVNAFLRNIENKATLRASGSDGGTTGTPHVQLNAPRTFGIGFGAKF